jgi:Domain of unknown function (DUF932)
MKAGKTLTELAQQLEDIKAKSRDFIVPTARLQMGADASLQFYGKDKETAPQILEPSDYAHGQIAGYASVPKAYYDRLRAEKPALLASNVNHGFERQEESRERGTEARMLRTYDGKLRALVSSSYRRLDSYDLCKVVLPTLVDNRFEVVSSEITETRMYLKALTKRVQSEVKPGDVVQYGIVISNSDVGAGSVRVEPLIYRLVCSNGMIGSTAIRKMHVGRDLAGADIHELLSDETQRLTDEAFWAQVNDVVRASMNQEIFEREVAKLREAAHTPIKNYDIPDVVDVTMKAVGVDGEGAKNDIIAYLARGADGAGLTQWGLINGFTFAAQNEKIGYDRSIELERAGAKVLDIDQRKWARIADAA